MFRLILTVAVAVGMARLGYACFVERDDSPFAEINLANRKLDIAWRNLNEFRSVMDQTLVELADEEITLAQAIERVVEVSRSHHPTYLRMLPKLKKESCVEERVGADLVCHFTAELDEDNGNQAQLNTVIARLRVELATLFPTCSQ